MVGGRLGLGLALRLAGRRGREVERDGLVVEQAAWVAGTRP